MFFVEPSRSRFDLHFSVLHTRVRVHPLFWLVTLLLAINLGDATRMAIWVTAVFLSILLHELGHVAAFRYFGMNADIVLYSFGGLAIARRPVWRGHWAQVGISFAGPLAGFIATGLIYVVCRLAGIFIRFHFGSFDIVRYQVPDFEPRNAYVFVVYLLWINLYWGLVNLMPIFPLDGGQIARALFEQYNVTDAIRKSLILSMLAAGWMILIALRHEAVVVATMFAYLGYKNYVALREKRDW